MISSKELTAKFEQQFEAAPTLIARAPGRINLIGEHTDYNGGFVLPAAIEYEIKMAARCTVDTLVRLHSLNYNESYEFDAVLDLEVPAKPQWYSYFLGVIDQFKKRGCPVPGMDVVISGDVPLGAGLSSSAAFEVCAATLINDIATANLSPKGIALLAQAAEHSKFVGVRCGIMDQFASALGADASALFIDCHSLDYETVPFDPAKAVIVIINSNKPRELRSSDYNTRRLECEEGLQLISQMEEEDFATLRHIPMDVFESHAEKLPEKVRQRVKHNLAENDRVCRFVDALKTSDWDTAGVLLYESHDSLRNDYEVSCDELDAIVDIAKSSDLVYGCRMTGGGFGGCAVALVNPDNVDEFSTLMSAEYKKRTNLEATIYQSSPVQGANIEHLK